MSMNEFDRILGMGDDNFSPFSKTHQILPVDFSDEEVAFAHELNSLFDVHHEELPPLFVQTLLESDAPCFEPVKPGFEHIMRARVFHSLNVHRRLFRNRRPSLQTLANSISMRKPIMALCTVMLLLVALTVFFTGPSFAMGIEILLQGARTGITQASKYPDHVNSLPANALSHAKQNQSQPTISVNEAQNLLTQYGWKMYWPTSSFVTSHYNFNGISLIQQYSQSQLWTNGPFIELDYSYTGATSKTPDVLAIGEFKVKPGVNVLQVVKRGAAAALNIDQYGQAQAIYIDGQWTMRDRVIPTWVKGESRELIYQANGIVFWIVGDPDTGINQNTLLGIAQSLQPLHINNAMHWDLENNMNSVAVLPTNVNGPFAGVVIAISQNGADDQIQYLSLGSTPLIPENPVTTHKSHSLPATPSH